jgi:hypothetical protein
VTVLVAMWGRLANLQLKGTADLQIRSGTPVPAAGNIRNMEADLETGCGTEVLQVPLPIRPLKTGSTVRAQS